MSKKNKRKFQQPRPEFRPVSNSESNMSSTSTITTSAAAQPSASFSSPTPPVAVPTLGQRPASAGLSDAHAEEYKVIKHDLVKVVILNALFLAGVLTLYYTNLNSGYLERWFGSILKF